MRASSHFSLHPGQFWHFFSAHSTSFASIFPLLSVSHSLKTVVRAALTSAADIFVSIETVVEWIRRRTTIISLMLDRLWHRSFYRISFGYEHGSENLEPPIIVGQTGKRCHSPSIQWHESTSLQVGLVFHATVSMTCVKVLNVGVDVMWPRPNVNKRLITIDTNALKVCVTVPSIRSDLAQMDSPYH